MGQECTNLHRKAILFFDLAWGVLFDFKTLPSLSTPRGHSAVGSLQPGNVILFCLECFADCQWVGFSW